MLTEKPKVAKVVVLGDIGRSPRMQYHTLSLAKLGYYVDVIGYGDTEPIPEIRAEPLVLHHYLSPCPQLPFRYLNYVFKTIFQALNLLFLLFITSKSDVLLVQNPPAIPTLIICWIYSKLLKCKLIIDWHNYAHTIMALNVGKKNPLVKITKKIEFFVGRRADGNLCVTNAMRDDLESNWDIKASTLYDRPPSIFKSLTSDEKHLFLEKLSNKYFQTTNVKFSEEIDGCVKFLNNRPGLLVSCTSWTEDEDFNILLEALHIYEDHIKNGNERKLPQLICVITGKGPLKKVYQRKFEQKSFENVKIETPWLPSEDYPLLLGSADIGVSLHTSSSGLDLPMKVVDMFGSGLPVFAYDFNCLKELVQNGDNGYTFTTSKNLSDLILDWFENFPINSVRNEEELKFKKNIETFQSLRWEENWISVVSPLLE